MAQILPRVVEPVPPPHVARLFTDVEGVSEPRLLAGAIREHLPVCFHLAREFSLDSPAIQQVPDASPPFPNVHVSSPSIAYVTRRYSATSFSSCFFPLAVIRYSRTCRPVSDVVHPAFTHPFSSSFCRAG